MSDSLPELVVHIAEVAEVGDPPVLIAAVAEDVDGGGFRLEFQRASVFDEQDRRLGMDTYCICTGEGATHYGGVRAIDAQEDRVLISLDEVAAARLHIPESFWIRLAVDVADAHAFLNALQRAVAGPSGT